MEKLGVEKNRQVAEKQLVGPVDQTDRADRHGNVLLTGDADKIPRVSPTTTTQVESECCIYAIQQRRGWQILSIETENIDTGMDWKEWRW